MCAIDCDCQRVLTGARDWRESELDLQEMMRRCRAQGECSHGKKWDHAEEWDRDKRQEAIEEGQKDLQALQVRTVCPFE